MTLSNRLQEINNQQASKTQINTNDIYHKNSLNNYSKRDGNNGNKNLYNDKDSQFKSSNTQNRPSFNNNSRSFSSNSKFSQNSPKTSLQSLKQESNKSESITKYKNSIEANRRNINQTPTPNQNSQPVNSQKLSPQAANISLNHEQYRFKKNNMPSLELKPNDQSNQKSRLLNFQIDLIWIF